MKKENIILTVELDGKNVPAKIEWKSSDNPNTNPDSEVKAFLLSLFTKNSMDTLKIDLWTKEMQVNEMDRFFYQTLKGMAETYKRATQNNPLAEDMAHFAKYFGEKTEIVPSDPQTK